MKLVLGIVSSLIGVFALCSLSFDAFAQSPTEPEILPPGVRTVAPPADELIGARFADESLSEDLKISFSQIKDQSVAMGKVFQELLSAIANLLSEDQILARRILTSPNLAAVSVNSWSDRRLKRPEKLLAIQQAVATLSDRVRNLIHEFDEVDKNGSCARAAGQAFSAWFRIYDQPCLRTSYYAEIFKTLLVPVNYGSPERTLVSGADLVLRSSNNLSSEEWEKIYSNYQRARHAMWQLEPLENEEWHRLLSNRLVEQVWREASEGALLLQWRSGRLTLIVYRNHQDDDWISRGYRYRVDFDQPPERETFYQLTLELSRYLAYTLTPPTNCALKLTTASPANARLAKPSPALGKP